jgi:hypothetical protein
MPIWSILHTFGKRYDNLVYFPPFRYVSPRKIWQPWYAGRGIIGMEKMLVHKHDAFNRALLRKCPDWRGAWPGSFAFV